MSEMEKRGKIQPFLRNLTTTMLELHNVCVCVFIRERERDCVNKNLNAAKLG